MTSIQNQPFKYRLAISLGLVINFPPSYSIAEKKLITISIPKKMSTKYSKILIAAVSSSMKASLNGTKTAVQISKIVNIICQVCLNLFLGCRINLGIAFSFFNVPYFDIRSCLRPSKCILLPSAMSLLYSSNQNRTILAPIMARFQAFFQRKSTRYYWRDFFKCLIGIVNSEFSSPSE